MNYTCFLSSPFSNVIVFIVSLLTLGTKVSYIPKSGWSKIDRLFAYLMNYCLHTTGKKRDEVTNVLFEFFEKVGGI
jgi:hypothetical protein